jgi:hypothetical protein
MATIRDKLGHCLHDSFTMTPTTGSLSRCCRESLPYPSGELVSPAYAAQSPFPFTGTIGKAVFDLVPRKD